MSFSFNNLKATSCFCLFFLLFSFFSLISAEDNKDEKTDEKVEMVDCMTCKGAGKTDCDNCVEGKMNCPDRCTKKDLSTRTDKVSKKGFIHVTFVDQQGKLHKSSCGQGHVGEVFNIQSGRYVSAGKCKTCKGTTIKECDKCKGVGTIDCKMCKATGKMPKAEFDEIIRLENEKREQMAYTLKDGSKFYGKFYSKSEKIVTIKTEEGKKVVLNISDLKSVPEKYKSMLLPDEE